MSFRKAVKDTNMAFIATFNNAIPIFRDFAILSVFFITLPLCYVFAVIYRMIKGGVK